MARKPLTVLVLAGMLFLVGFSSSGRVELAPSPAQAAAERHPKIRSAIRELREARRELEAGAKIFGGHRVKAIKAVDDAIEQLQKALTYTGK